MKEGIHPKYHEVEARCACGATWKTRSTKPELHLEICNNCHPFFTGRQKLIDTEGRVERFTKRFGAQTSESRKAGRPEGGEEAGRRQVGPGLQTPPEPGLQTPATHAQLSKENWAFCLSRQLPIQPRQPVAHAVGPPATAVFLQRKQRQLAGRVQVAGAVLLMDGQRLDGELAQAVQRRGRAAATRLGRASTADASSPRLPRTGPSRRQRKPSR